MVFRRRIKIARLLIMHKDMRVAQRLWAIINLLSLGGFVLGVR